MVRVCADGAKCPKSSSPRNPRQEFAVVLALALAHAIRAPEPDVPALTGSSGRAKNQAGQVSGAASVPIDLLTGSPSRITCRIHTGTSRRSFILRFSPPMAGQPYLTTTVHRP